MHLTVAILNELLADFVPERKSGRAVQQLMRANRATVTHVNG